MICRRMKAGGWVQSRVINAALLWFLERPADRDQILSHYAEYAGHSGRKE